MCLPTWKPDTVEASYECRCVSACNMKDKRKIITSSSGWQRQVRGWNQSLIHRFLTATGDNLKLLYMPHSQPCSLDLFCTLPSHYKGKLTPCYGSIPSQFSAFTDPHVRHIWSRSKTQTEYWKRDYTLWTHRDNSSCLAGAHYIQMIKAHKSARWTHLAARKNTHAHTHTLTHSHILHANFCLPFLKWVEFYKSYLQHYHTKWAFHLFYFHTITKVMTPAKILTQEV